MSIFIFHQHFKHIPLICENILLRSSCCLIETQVTQTQHKGLGQEPKGGVFQLRVNIQTTYVIVSYPRPVPENITFLHFRGSLYFSNIVLSFYIFLLSCRTDNIVEKHIVLMWPFYTMSNRDKTFSFETQQKQNVKSNTNVLILHNVKQR